MALDPDHPIPDISAGEPSGPNLEFDADFTEFERLAVGKPEQQYGATVVPAEEPDWKLVVAAGNALLERTYDLRVLALLAVARLQREGLVGYAATLATTAQMVRDRWDSVHPQLDAEDDNDPTLRANALLTVVTPARVVRVLRNMPLARSPRAGAVSWRDIAIANGTVDAEEGQEKMQEAVIAAAFRETDPGAFAALQQAIVSASDSIAAIPATFDERAGYGTGPDFTDMAKLLREMRQMTERYAPVAAAPLPLDDAEAAQDGSEPETAKAEDMVTIGAAVPRPRSAVVTAASLGPVTTRADALRLLDLAIEYYERYEPSSPLPLLISRARRLADKGFLDLLRDLAPDGVGQAERIVGGES